MSKVILITNTTTKIKVKSRTLERNFFCHGLNFLASLFKMINYVVDIPVCLFPLLLIIYWHSIWHKLGLFVYRSLYIFLYLLKCLFFYLCWIVWEFFLVFVASFLEFYNLCVVYNILSIRFQVQRVFLLERCYVRK